jgi:CubicO group peptidase (beta-lactamase class C family)
VKFHSKAICVLGVAVLFLAPSALAQPSGVINAMKTNGIPSISFAIIRNGKITNIAAYGMQSPGITATPNTLYNIASLTKPLTAEIILRLATRGILDLDAPMYPTFVDPDIASDPRSGLLTPRLALSHQIGFPNWRRNEKLKFLFNPGTDYGYSGEGYQYVARYAEKKTDKTFEGLADKYLFKPLGLKNTSYVSQPWFEGRVAVPSIRGRSIEPIFTQHFVAADLVYTTAADYACFMLSVLRDDSLKPSIAADRIRIQRSLKSALCDGTKAITCPDDIGPGLGWQILTFVNHTILTHDGSDPGVTSFAYLDKATGDGAVIFANGENVDKVVLPLLEQFNANPAFVTFLRDHQ